MLVREWEKLEKMKEDGELARLGIGILGSGVRPVDLRWSSRMVGSSFCHYGGNSDEQSSTLMSSCLIELHIVR